MSPAATSLAPVRSVAELQQQLRTHAGTAHSQSWTHELVAAAPNRGGAAATVHHQRVVVLAAHSGAGASTVALAMADAAEAAGETVHLVEVSEPMRSGLSAASDAELGVVSSGDWRRGRRGRSIFIDRPTILAAAERWSSLLTEAPQTIVDLGLTAWASLAALANGTYRLVVVGRATVPGIRATERVLAQLADPSARVAIVGAGRWPGEVRASSGYNIRAAVEAGLLVAVPLSKRLDAYGPDQRQLPAPVVRAGSGLLVSCRTNSATTEMTPR